MKSSLAPYPRRTWPVVLLTLVLGVACGAGAGLYYRNQPVSVMVDDVPQPPDVVVELAAIEQTQAENRFLRAQLDTAEGEIAVERAARKELEVQLRSAQDDLGQVRERLAFFEQLLPPGPGGVVDIRGAEVVRDGQGLSYRVLLMRNGPSEPAFKGSLRFQATGVLEGKDVSLDLEPMQITPESGVDAAQSSPTAAAGSPVASDPLSLQFDKYQRSEGVLRVPDGFVPDSVVVSVLEGNTVRASRTIRLAF